MSKLETNLEKAKDLIYNSKNRDLHTDKINVLSAILSCEVAAKTNWFYPSKNEFPKTGEMVYLALSNGSYKNQLFDEFDKPTVDYFKNEFYVKAWCYMPTL